MSVAAPQQFGKFISLHRIIINLSRHGIKPRI
jgi:hypothetical protein